jgi:DNA-directed RNA polymerase specialized sigma24 family protein
MRSTDPPTPELLAQIEAASVNDELMTSLGAYALCKLRGLDWRGRRGGAVPGGVDAQDVVQIAFERLLGGIRKWDATKNPDFGHFLLSVIDSIVSDLVRSPKNHRERELSAFAFETDESESAIIERLHSRVDYSEASEADELVNSDFLIAVIGEVEKDDPPLHRILEAIVFEQIAKREQLAAHLSLAPSEITNAFKRLNRRLPKLATQFAHLNPPAIRQ